MKLWIAKNIWGRRQGIASATIGIAASLAALAGSAQADTLPTNIIQTPSDVVNIFCGAMHWLYWGLIVFSIVMFLIGGYTYAASGGNAENVGKATKTLTFAAIALVVALVARGVPLLVASFFGVQITGC